MTHINSKEKYGHKSVFNENIIFESVSIKSKDSVLALERFYRDIYIPCFPDSDERETLESILSYLRAGNAAAGNAPAGNAPAGNADAGNADAGNAVAGNASAGNADAGNADAGNAVAGNAVAGNADAGNAEAGYSYHIELARDEKGNILGGCIFDYFKKSNSGIIEFLAIKPELQSRGIGTRLYAHVLSVLRKDALKATGLALRFAFCEIEAPELSKADIKKYLHFWHKNGYRRLNFSYIQPSLSAYQSPVYGLWLTAMTFESDINSLNADTVMSVIGDYMRYCMNIHDFSSNFEYNKMKAEAESKSPLALLSIL